MARNNKRTSKQVASDAARALQKPQSSDILKSMAAAALSQRDPNKQTGADMEDKASKVLRSEKYSDETKRFAATVLSQSNKKR
jgi:hypothetical protein